MRDPYTFLLDFIPLTENIGDENRVLADALVRNGLNLLPADAPAKEVSRLVQLCTDLGYMDPDVAAYLLRQLAGEDI